MLIRVLSCILVIVLAGCARVPALPTLPGITPYRMDIPQGNVVTQDMVAKLKPGMTREQVRFALGTPLIVDPFRTDRWDYVYRYEKAGTLHEHRRIAILFKDDALLRIEGDVVTGAARDEAPAGATGAAGQP
jgi:outer membrane protein assembly factor BamE